MVIPMVDDSENAMAHIIYMSIFLHGPCSWSSTFQKSNVDMIREQERHEEYKLSNLPAASSIAAPKQAPEPLLKFSDGDHTPCLMEELSSPLYSPHTEYYSVAFEGLQLPRIQPVGATDIRQIGRRRSRKWPGHNNAVIDTRVLLNRV